MIYWNSKSSFYSTTQVKLNVIRVIKQNVQQAVRDL